jgi:hypothetical protein
MPYHHQMMKAIENLTPAELVSAMLSHREMEQTQRYLSAGRALRSIATVDLEIRWTVAVKRFWKTRSPEAELALNNISAELRLRTIKPPLATVQKELEAISAEIERDYYEPSQRLADHLTDQITDFLMLLADRKH